MNFGRGAKAAGTGTYEGAVLGLNKLWREHSLGNRKRRGAWTGGGAEDFGLSSTEETK